MNGWGGLPKRKACGMQGEMSRDGDEMFGESLHPSTHPVPPYTSLDTPSPSLETHPLHPSTLRHHPSTHPVPPYPSLDTPSRYTPCLCPRRQLLPRRVRQTTATCWLHQAAAKGLIKTGGVSDSERAAWPLSMTAERVELDALGKVSAPSNPA